MKPLRWLPMLVLLESIALLSGVRAAPETDGPAAVAQALYHSAFIHFGFTPDTVKSNRPWLTPGLYSRLWKKVNEPTPPGDAPDIEADVFLDCQDPPDKFVVGEASIDQTEAKVEVTLVWPGASGERRHYRAFLKQIDGAWKVYDIDYGQDGKLTDLLK
jgi:hypothetical protein